MEMASVNGVAGKHFLLDEKNRNMYVMSYLFFSVTDCAE